MQDAEEKKTPGRHVAPPKLQTPASEQPIRTETDVYGDETDLPLRSKKKRQSSSKKNRKSRRKRPASLRGQQKRAHKWSIQSFLRRLDPRNRPAKIRRLISYTKPDPDSGIPAQLQILGRTIPFAVTIAVLTLALLFMYSVLNNSNLDVDQQKVTVVGLSGDLENYKLLVLSDLNGQRYGDRQSALLRVINNNDFNVVFCLGDMVGKGGDPEPFYELLEGLPKNRKVYFISGDADPGPYVEQARATSGSLSQLVLADWILGAKERGAIYVDGPVELNVGNSSIWISPSTIMNLEAAENLNTWKEQVEQEDEGVRSGLAADYLTLPITSYRYRQAQQLYDLIDKMEEDDLYVTLSHQIPSANAISAANNHDGTSGKYANAPELILAGHYCGGVWRVPLLGAFFVPDAMLPRNGWFPAQSSVQGLSSFGTTQAYITGGLSTNSSVPLLPFRLFNRPQISILTLTATLPENMLSAE